MVQRSDVKIDDLPKRKDDERVELKDQPDCSHFFEMKKANEVECNKCGWRNDDEIFEVENRIDQLEI